MLGGHYVTRLIAPLSAEQIIELISQLDSEYKEGLRNFTVKSSLIKSLVEKDPFNAFIYLYENPDTARMHSYPMLIDWRIKENELQKVANFLERSPPNLYKRDYISRLAERWGGSNPVAALAWAAKLDDPAPTIDRIYWTWATKDPDAVAMLLPTQADSPLRKTMIDAVLSGFINRDPEMGIAWINSLPAHEHFSATMAAILRLCTKKHPAKAAELYDQTFLNKRLDSSHRDWLMSMSRANAIAEAWSQSDPIGAAQWIEQLPTGARRDSATHYFVTNVAETDPATALEWAETISNPDQRYDAIDDVIYNWGQKDPNAARASVAAMDLPESKRARLQRRIR